jgi:hypothetical protein
MINWCFYCELETAGEHESNCPLNPDNRTCVLTKSEFNTMSRLNVPIKKFHSPESLAHKDEV